MSARWVRVVRRAAKVAMVAGAVLGSLGIARAASYTYQVGETLLCPSCSNGKMTVGGLITVDALGTLSASDITGWNLALVPNATEYTLSPTNSAFRLQGGATITATADALQIEVPAKLSGFDFTSNDGLIEWVYVENDVGQLADIQIGEQNLIGANALDLPTTFMASSVSSDAPVPEPTSLLLMGTGTGMLALGGFRRRVLSRVRG